MSSPHVSIAGDIQQPYERMDHAEQCPAYSKSILAFIAISVQIANPLRTPTLALATCEPVDSVFAAGVVLSDEDGAPESVVSVPEADPAEVLVKGAAVTMAEFSVVE
mmetsp:Transcript_83466/g.131882  ORF Transcript_83466/g.131882 Transcript_83466/m.131882 type:complete len:107 (-) Transcript_83466:2989-3309(-)